MRAIFAIALILFVVAVSAQQDAIQQYKNKKIKKVNKEIKEIQRIESYQQTSTRRPLETVSVLTQAPFADYDLDFVGETHIALTETEAPIINDVNEYSAVEEDNTCVNGFSDYNAVDSSDKWAIRYKKRRDDYTLSAVKRDVAIAVASTVGWHAFKHAAAAAAAKTAADLYAAQAFGTVAASAGTSTLATIGSVASGLGLAYTGYKIGNYVLGKASLRYRLWQICMLNKRIKKLVNKVAIDSQDGMGFFGRRRAKKLQEKIDLFYRWIVNAEKRINRRIKKARERRQKLGFGSNCVTYQTPEGPKLKCDSEAELTRFEQKTEQFKSKLVECTKGGEAHKVIYRRKCVRTVPPLPPRPPVIPVYTPPVLPPIVPVYTPPAPVETPPAYIPKETPPVYVPKNKKYKKNY